MSSSQERRLLFIAPLNKLSMCKRSPRMPGKRDGAARAGGAGPDLAASSPEPPWNRGQESRLWSMSLVRGVFQEV